MIMYPNLYKGLGLKLEDRSKYDTPLVGFDGKIVVPEGQIKLLVVIKGKEVMVNFIIINTFSPYIVIWVGLGFVLWRQYHPRCIRRLSSQLKMELSWSEPIKRWHNRA